jgi:DNA-binding CsgD family transcriptional regulator
MRSSRLVGRDRELATVRRALTAARRGRGGLLLVAGEAGIGKTALVERALDRAGLVVLRGTTGGAATMPLGSLVRAIRFHPEWPEIGPAVIERVGRGRPGGDAARILLGLDPPTDVASRILVPAPPVVVDGRADVLEVVCEVFIALARRRSLVLVVEDLQAADYATLEALALIAARAAHEPLLAIGAYRTDEIPRGSAVRRLRVELRRMGRLDEIELGPLDAEATIELASQVLGARPDDTLAGRLVDRSQGLPLFVEELAAALLGDDAVSVSGDRATLARAELPIPDTLRDSILMRTDGLSPAARRALVTVALLGDPIDGSLVDELAPDAGTWLRDGLERGILTDRGGVVKFRHALVREVLVDELAAPERRSRHRLAAAVLADRGAEPLVIADHWLRGGEPRKAIPWLLSSAAASRRVHAYRDAAAAYRRALEEDQGTLESRVAVIEWLAECAELAGSPAEASRTWERAAVERAEEGQTDLAAQAHARQARCLEVIGRWARAIGARLAAADAFAAAGLPAEAATERLAAAAHLRSAASFSAAQALLALTRTEAAAAGRVDLVARAIGLDGNVRARLGRFDEGLAQVRQGLSLALDGGHVAAAAELYQRLADSLEHGGHYDPARSAYLEGAAYCRTEGLGSSAQLCVACMTMVLWQTGQWSRAEGMGRDVIRSGDAALHARAVAEGIVGIIAALRGSVTRARPHLEASVQLARHIELAAMDLTSTWGLALCDRLDGDEAAVLERCARLRERWSGTEERHYVVPALRWVATVYEDLGDGPGVRACAEALARIAAQTAQPEAVAALGATLGAAASIDGEVEAAAQHLVRALAAVSTRDLPLDRAEIGRRAGIAVVRAGRREEGVELLVAAARTARRLGAIPLGRAIAADLATIGESVERRLGRREARRLADHGLTRRELEVVRLVARGMTSRQIGQALFISPRTVEMHAGSVLAKLDCQTRAEAVQRLATLGLLSPAAAS